MYIVGDDPAHLTFTVSVEERRFASLGSMPPLSGGNRDTPSIRDPLVPSASAPTGVSASEWYRHTGIAARSAVCAKRAPRGRAHYCGRGPAGGPIGPERTGALQSSPRGLRRPSNGIRPDYVVEVRRDVLEETDGPMLIHGLQGFQGQRLRLPRGKPGCQTGTFWKSDTHGFGDLPS